MKISYSITVCNELNEIHRLVDFLLKHKRHKDSIIILFDSLNGDPAVEEYLRSHSINGEFHWYKDAFPGVFAGWKNKLNRLSVGDWIFNIDADEMPNEFLIKSLPMLIEMNPDIEAYWVPRINTLNGDKDEILKYVKSQNWNIDENGYINKWDPQMRIYKNDVMIEWEGKVHEKLIGYKKFASLPYEESYCLYHPKTLTRQIKQNELYNNINS